MKRGFVSDNCAGAHPEIIKAIGACNAGHAPSYGNDEYCARAAKRFGELMEREVPVTFVFNGTGANVVSLACSLRPFESVVCADCAHINMDETGAPERVLGSKLQGIPTPDGKLTAEKIAPLLSAQGNMHHSQPRVLSLTNVTEWGAVYTPEEIRALADFAHAHGMLVHMDGARIANAVVAANCTMAEMTWKAGLDVLSFGGVKNGTIFGEAVLFFNEILAEKAAFVRKNVTQLQSKLRFVGAQFEALLQGGLWRKNAAHANAMAKRLEEALAAFPAIEITHPAQANMLFMKMPENYTRAVCAGGFGSDMGGIVRMVCSWDTEQEDIEALARALGQVVS